MATTGIEDSVPPLTVLERIQEREIHVVSSADEPPNRKQEESEKLAPTTVTVEEDVMGAFVLVVEETTIEA